MIPLYLDEDTAAGPFIAALRQRGMDVLSAGEAGYLGRSDRHQLLLATRLGRAICSGNTADYSRLHTEFMNDGYEHAGIIIVARNLAFREKIDGLVRLIESTDESRLVSRMEYVANWVIRP